MNLFNFFFCKVPDLMMILSFLVSLSKPSKDLGYRRRDSSSRSGIFCICTGVIHGQPF